MIQLHTNYNIYNFLFFATAVATKLNPWLNNICCVGTVKTTLPLAFLQLLLKTSLRYTTTFAKSPIVRPNNSKVADFHTEWPPELIIC